MHGHVVSRVRGASGRCRDHAGDVHLAIWPKIARVTGVGWPLLAAGTIPAMRCR